MQRKRRRHRAIMVLICGALALFPWIGAQVQAAGNQPPRDVAWFRDHDAKVDVYLLPMDDFPLGPPDVLSAMLTKDLQIYVKASLPMGSAGLPKVPDTSQLSSQDIIDRAMPVFARLPGCSDKCMAVVLTSRDINEIGSTLRFSFAFNDHEKRISVVSSARMMVPRYSPWLTGETMVSPSDVLPRLFKIIKRAIGLTYYQLPRSTGIEDVMYSPIMSVSDLDAIGTEYKTKQ